MADPRRASSRRAALSYQHLKNLTVDSGAPWPDLLLKDYQGILQDSAFIFDELDLFDIRITQNELDILDLQERVAALEYRAFNIVTVTDDYIAEEFEMVICRNTAPKNITLKTSPLLNDEIHVKRADAEVTIIGTIDGIADMTLNVLNYSLHLVYNGTDWSTI